LISFFRTEKSAEQCSAAFSGLKHAVGLIKETPRRDGFASLGKVAS